MESIVLHGESRREAKLMNEVLKELISHIELPTDQLKDQDPEIREIFIEEVQEIIEFLDETLPKWLADPSSKAILTDIRRSYHTLKGSGRMAGAVRSGELAWSIEEMLNRVMSDTITLNRDIQELVYSVAVLYKTLVQDFENDVEHQVDFRPWVVAAQQLRDGGELHPTLRFAVDYYRTQEIPSDDVVVGDTIILAEQPAEHIEDISATQNKEIESFDDQTLEIFFEESAEHLDTISMFLHLQQEPSVENFNRVLRAVHTIRGSSGMVGIDALFTASSNVENVFKHLDQGHYSESTVENQLLLDYYEYVKAYVTVLAEDRHSSSLDTLSQEFAAIWTAYEANSSVPVANSHTQGLVAKLLDLGTDELLDAEFAFVEETARDAQSYLIVLIEQADVLLNHTLSKQTETLHKVTQYLKRCYVALQNNQPAIDNIDVLEQTQKLHQYLIDALDGLASGQTLAMTHLVEEEFEQTIAEIQHVVIADAENVAQPAEILESLPANSDFDADLLDIFLEESDELVVGMDEDFNTWEQEPDNTAVLKNLFRYLHTLKGGANMVQATHLGTIAHELESIYERVLKGVLQPSAQVIQTIRFAQDDIAVRLQKLRDQSIDEDNPILIAKLRAISTQSTVAEPEHIVEETSEISFTLDLGAADNAKPEMPMAADLSFEHPQELVSFDSLTEAASSLEVQPANRDFDADLLDIFLEESDELVVGMDEDFNTWEQEPDNTAVLKNLFRYLHTLKGGANMVQATHLGVIAHELESIYERVLKGVLQPSAQAIQTIRFAQDDIAVRLQKLRDQSIDEDNPALIARLRQIAAGQEISAQPVVAPVVIPEPSSSQIDEIELTVPEENTQEMQALLVDEPVEIEQLIVEQQQTLPEEDHNVNNAVEDALPPVLVKAFEQADDAQVAIVESYLEEAEELLEQADAVFEQWLNDRSNRNVLLTLQRTYHTMKGNARVVNEVAISVIAGQLEMVFEQFSLYQFSSSRYDELLQQAQHWLRNAIFKGQSEGENELKARLQAIRYEDSLIPADEALSSTIDFEGTDQYAFVEGDGSTPPSMYAEIKKVQEQAQEQIRISADLVEKMIDLSGENAINRSRIELDLGQMTFTLSEMELAILRLADQLRRMEGELETQILTKHEVSGQRYESFDPLEMDQYSSLNQLSKSLVESVTDLVDFKNTLSDKIRDTESLLLQQSRIQSELQQNLMGTRLVPFARLVPRLQRLVRQTSTQLNRPVDFNIENTEGELDRNILERLVSPLEHMLRNAIDHGIEDQEQRAQVGKAATGRITLNIAREGNDILVIFSDDGRGIDVAAVRSKAEQNGLITANMQVSDIDVMQYIFNSGLSTAKKVTQISGRGVGLDVVQSEIKALGGHVSVNSELGKGTEFTIRVPTTVAVSDALMVKVGEQQFALPLAQIERIVRVSPVALAEYYEGTSEQFELDHQLYRLRYVGEFVTGQARPILNNMGSSIPVIIFNSGGRSVALQVDQLVGSRAQIVIKSIGKQMSSVGFVGGATILADGRVSLILDGSSIARRVLTTKRPQQAEVVVQQSAETRTARRRTIMVVDDSVTVRKVTSRLLERNGFDVVTAKDGIDAIEVLATVTPDLMLLDIEMPRMDGFEVAAHVRHDSKHKQLPIIMITSRTGEKHREHAFSLGVNQYMGKPFQESELLENIQNILGIVKVS